MLRIDFTNEELDKIKSKIHFTPLQERIINYRLDEYSITKMAMEENCSESTISREIKKIKKKIMKVIS
jgi:IS30 family transposase